MSDDLKADLVAILSETVIPGDKRSARAWQARCEMIVDQVIDRCMYAAFEKGFHDGALLEEVTRLTYELKAAKMLIDPGKEGMAALKALALDNEKITAESVWLRAVMATLVEQVRARNLDEVIRICEVYARRVNMHEEDASVH